MSAITFDQVKTAFTNFVTKYDSNVIQVDEAIAAAQASFKETTDDQVAEATLAEKIEELKSAVRNLDSGGSLDDVLAKATAAVQANGMHVIEHQQMLDAIATSITEQAQADASTDEAKAALAEIQQNLNDFTL